MNTRSILSLTIMLTATASVCFGSAVSASELSRDHRAHRACLDRLEAVAHREQLPLKAAPTWRAPQAAAGDHHYYVNTEARGLDQVFYRIECEATRLGRVTYFALEPGRWIYETPDNPGLAVR